MRSRRGAPAEADVRLLETRARSLRPARWSGYRREDVDALIGRAIAALRAAIADDERLRAGAPRSTGRRSDADDAETLDVEGAVFGIARFRRAYDMRSVDQLLDEVDDALQALVAERRALGSRPGGPALR